MSLAKRANETHDLLVWMEELPSVFNYVLMISILNIAILPSPKIYIYIYYYFKDFTNSDFFFFFERKMTIYSLT